MDVRVVVSGGDVGLDCLPFGVIDLNASIVLSDRSLFAFSLVMRSCLCCRYVFAMFWVRSTLWTTTRLFSLPWRIFSEYYLWILRCMHFSLFFTMTMLAVVGGASIQAEWTVVISRRRWPQLVCAFGVFCVAHLYMSLFSCESFTL